MIQKLKRFWFAKAKSKAREQSELIQAIRTKMEAAPEMDKPELKIWRVGSLGIVQTLAYDLSTIAIMKADEYGNLDVLMSWMEVRGEITNMDQKDFTAEHLVMYALS